MAKRRMTLVLFVGESLLTDLFVVELEGSEVFAGLGELALLHPLADVPEAFDKGELAPCVLSPLPRYHR